MQTERRIYALFMYNMTAGQAGHKFPHNLCTQCGAEGDEFGRDPIAGSFIL